MAKKEVEGLVAVIYARYSSENQREESIEGQMRECYAFAKKNEISVVGEYIDRAFFRQNRPPSGFSAHDQRQRKAQFQFGYRLEARPFCP